MIRGVFEVARLEGFEPPTAWFVARYSIQLSYRRFEAAIMSAPSKAVKTSSPDTYMAEREGFEPSMEF